jgi:hypothetical protein
MKRGSSVAARFDCNQQQTKINVRRRISKQFMLRRLGPAEPPSKK